MSLFENPFYLYIKATVITMHFNSNPRPQFKFLLAAHFTYFLCGEFKDRSNVEAMNRSAFNTNEIQLNRIAVSTHFERCITVETPYVRAGRKFFG